MVFYTAINTEALPLPLLILFSDKGKLVPVQLGVGTIHHRVPTPTPLPLREGNHLNEEITPSSPLG
jgi:hypothetical protein